MPSATSFAKRGSCGDVLDHERRPRRQHPAGDAGSRGEAPAEQPLLALADDGLEDELVRRPRRAAGSRTPWRRRSRGRPRRPSGAARGSAPRSRATPAATAALQVVAHRRSSHVRRGQVAARSSAGTASARDASTRISAQIPATCGVAKLLPGAAERARRRARRRRRRRRGAKNSTGGFGL